jgi:hypothetical protein
MIVIHSFILEYLQYIYIFSGSSGHDSVQDAAIALELALIKAQEGNVVRTYTYINSNLQIIMYLHVYTYEYKCMRIHEYKRVHTLELALVKGQEGNVVRTYTYINSNLQIIILLCIYIYMS